MPITTQLIDRDQAAKIIATDEGQFSEAKATEITPAKLTRTISAFANSDGGDLYIGIAEEVGTKTRKWLGFANSEQANGHLQAFESCFPLGTNFHCDFLKCDGLPGEVLHVQVNKTQGIIKASNGIPYIRRGAANLPQNAPEAYRRLEYSKGVGYLRTGHNDGFEVHNYRFKCHQELYQAGCSNGGTRTLVEETTTFARR